MIKALFGASSELLQDRSSESIEDFVIVDDSESPAPKAAISAERPMQSPEDSPVKETQNKQAAGDKTLMTAVPQKEISDQSQKMDSRDHYGEKSTQRASQTEPSMFSSKKLRSSGPRVSAKENLIASDNHSEEPQSTPSLNETNMAERDCSVTSRSIPVHRTLKHAAADESKSLPVLLGPPVPMSATVRSKISKETNIPTSEVESEERVGIQDTRNSARTSHHPAFHGSRRWSLPSGNDNMLPDDAVVNFDSDRPKIVDCIRAQSPRILTHEQRRSAEKARRDSDLLESVHYEKTSRDRAEGSARKSRESRGKTRSRDPEYTLPRYQNEFYQDLCGLCHFPVPEYQPYTVELAGIFYHKRCIAEHLFSSSELRAALRSRYEEPRRKRKHSRKCSVWQKMVKGISDFFKAK